MSNKMLNKRKRIIIRRAVIDTFTGIMFMVFLLSMSAMDSEVFIIPMVGMAVSLTWIVIYAWANGMIG